MLKVTEESEYCTQTRIDRLKSIGIDTDGQIDELIQIMATNGLKLPYKVKEGFRFELQDDNCKLYIYIYLTLADACAEKLIKMFSEINGKTNNL